MNLEINIAETLQRAVQLQQAGNLPQVTFEHTELGMNYIAHRSTGDGASVERVTSTLLPNVVLVPGSERLDMAIVSRLMREHRIVGLHFVPSLLDLFGPRGSSAAATRLVGVGLIAVGPTAWTGWAEWSAAEPRDQRVGLVHAITNGLAIGVYTASWIARQ